MATERQPPLSVLASANLTGTIADIDEDPDSPDANFMAATANNVNTDVRTDFNTPSGSPTVGADLQEFKAYVEQYDEGQTGEPDARIELWENGVLIRAGSDTSVPNGGLTLSFTWNANELATADGSLVELKVVGTKIGGAGGTRNAVSMGAVEWNVDYAPAGDVLGTAALDGSATVVAAGTVVTPTHTVKTANWQWFTNATPDASMAQLANENTKPTLTGPQMRNTTLRLRVQLEETGGLADTGKTIELEYSWNNGADWAPFLTMNNSMFGWVDGAATVGDTIGTQKLTGTTSSGKYHEAADATESVGALAVHEIDCAIQVRWPAPDTDVRFRVWYDGAEISADSPIEIATSTAADRQYAVGRLKSETSTPDPLVNRSFRYTMMERSFYDGTRWWFFMVDEENPTQMDYWYWDGPGNDWSYVGYITFSADINKGAFDIAGKNISGNPVVWAVATPAASGADDIVYYNRGEISGTTITWDGEANFSVANQDDNVVAVSLDDGDYVWIGGYQDNASNDVFAVRSTNPDLGSSWSSGWESISRLSDEGGGSRAPISIVGLASNKAMLIWEAATADLRYCTVTNSGFDTPGQLNATTNAHEDNTGVTRSGGYVYVVHTDVDSSSGGNWVLRVFNESSETWSTGTDPSQVDPGGSNDGIALSSDDNHVFVFSTGDIGSGARGVGYRVYTGQGDAGTWDSGLQYITPAGERGNGDVISAPRAVGSGVLLVFFQFNDDGVEGYYHTIEYHYLLLGEAALVGSATLTAEGSVGGNIVEGNAALAGSATLIAVGSVESIEFGTATIVGSATLSAQGSVSGVVLGEVVLSGSGSLSAEGTLDVSGISALDGSASLTAVGIVSGEVQGQAALSGQATLTAEGQRDRQGASGLTGSGTLAASGTVVGTTTTLTVGLYQGAALIASWEVEPTTDFTSVAQTLTAGELASITDWSDLRLRFSATGADRVQVSQIFLEAPLAAVLGQAALQGTATLAAEGTTAGVEQGEATLSGSASLIAAAQVFSEVEGQAALSGTAVLSAEGLIEVAGEASLTGQAALAVSGDVVGSVSGAAALSGTATLITLGQMEYSGGLQVAGQATLSAVGSRDQEGQAALTGTANLSVVGTVGGEILGEATLLGTATLGAEGVKSIESSSAFTGSASLSPTGTIDRGGASSLSGSATLGAAPQLTLGGVVSVVGSATLSAIGERIRGGVAALSGSATLVAVGTRVVVVRQTVALTLEVDSGILTLKTEPGTLSLETEAGDITLETEPATVTLETEAGSITLEVQ